MLNLLANECKYEHQGLWMRSLGTAGLHGRGVLVQCLIEVLFCCIVYISFSPSFSWSVPNIYTWINVVDLLLLNDLLIISFAL